MNDKGVVGFPKSLNYAGRACVLVQNVQDEVTALQVDSAARWAAAQIRSGLARPDATWWGHRDFAWKACPGDTGYARLPEIRALTAHYVKVGFAPEPAPVSQEDDDVFIYEYKKPDGFEFMVLVAGGKQVRVTGESYSAGMRNLASYTGWVDAGTFSRYEKAYGPVIG